VSEVIIIGLDSAKYVFHVHGADERGRVIFSKRISPGKLLDFFAARPNCTVALEHVVERITGPVSLPSLAMKFG
jgi:transposase